MGTEHLEQVGSYSYLWVGSPYKVGDLIKCYLIYNHLIRQVVYVFSGLRVVFIPHEGFP